MKGKSNFKQSEIEQLKSLIRQRCNAIPSEQKAIRDKMRGLGFYVRDDWGITDMTIEKFERLIVDGVIKVIE